MLRACIPIAIQIVLDDVGWWSGRDGSADNQPYRTGIARDHVVDDYRALARLGHRLGMRVQAPLVLCEWDRHNRLRALPSSQWMGEAWDNSGHVGPWLEEAAAVLAENREHVEVTLHGLGHEYWEDGRMSRAEWHDMDCVMRPRDQVVAHMEMYARLLEDSALGPFPESFVPCAGRYRFGVADGGIDAILRTFGVRYTNTPFSCAGFDRATQHPQLGIADGVVTIDRGNDFTAWHALGHDPVEGHDGSRETPAPVCGLHWPNVLHADPSRNGEVVDRWVAHFSPLNHRFDRMLARDTAECWTQFAHHACVTLTPQDERVTLDFAALDGLPDSAIGDTFTLKVGCDEGATPIRASEGLTITASRRDEVAGHLVLSVQRARGVSTGTVGRLIP